MLEEREDEHSEEEHQLRINSTWPIASGGRLGVRRSFCKNFKIQVDRECEQLILEIAGLKVSLRNYEIED